MLQIWIPPLEVKYPRTITPDKPFNITFNLWYLTNLFKKIQIKIRIKDNNKTIFERTFPFFVWWFWKKNQITINLTEGITEGQHQLTIQATHTE